MCVCLCFDICICVKQEFLVYCTWSRRPLSLSPFNTHALYLPLFPSAVFFFCISLIYHRFLLSTFSLLRFLFLSRSICCSFFIPLPLSLGLYCINVCLKLWWPGLCSHLHLIWQLSSPPGRGQACSGRPNAIRRPAVREDLKQRIIITERDGISSPKHLRMPLGWEEMQLGKTLAGLKSRIKDQMNRHVFGKGGHVGTRTCRSTSPPAPHTQLLPPPRSPAGSDGPCYGDKEVRSKQWVL